MATEIRDITRADYNGTYRDVLADASANLSTDEPPLSPREFRARDVGRIDGRDHGFIRQLVYERDGFGVVGSVTLHICRDGDDLVCEGSELRVHRTRSGQGNGVAIALVERGLAVARDMGCVRVTAFVNRAGIKMLLEGSGYSVIEDRGDGKYVMGITL